MECAFGPCTYAVASSGDLCGPTCRLGVGETVEPCKCGHVACSAATGMS